MKRALLLCATIGAALVLGGCADQNTAATPSTLKRGTIYAVPGGGGVGGGGGGVPGTNPIKNIP